MKGNVSTKDLQEAKARVEQAGQIRTNALRRLRRAEEAVKSATADVEKADEDLKSASADLDQIVRKVMTAAMRKGGSDLSLALADLLAKSLPQDESEDHRGSSKSPDLLSDTGSASEGQGTADPVPSDDGGELAPAPASAPSEGAVTAAEPSDNVRTSLLDDAA